MRSSSSCSSPFSCWDRTSSREAGRTLGKTVNSFKKALSDSNLNLKDEVDAIKKETGSSEVSQKAKDTEAQFKSELADLRKDLDLKDHTSNPKA